LTAGRQALPALQAGGIVVNQVAFSPDGNLLAAGRADGTTLLWDARTFEPAGDPLVGQRGVVNQTVFVPGSPLLVTATPNSVALWDTALVRPLGSNLAEPGGAAITGVAFSRDGRSVASTATDGRVELWYLSAGRPVGPPVSLESGRDTPATAVSFSPDRRRLAVGMGDGSLILFDAAAADVVRPTLPVGRAGVTALAFNPRGDLLAAGEADGSIVLVDPRSWSVRHRLSSHQAGPVAGLAFSPDGSLLASSGGDGRLVLDNVRRLQSAALTVRAPETMGGVAYRLDGRRIAAAYSALAVVVNAPEGTRSTPLLPGGGAVEAVAFSPDGRLLATAVTDGTVSLWDPDAQTRLGPPLAGPAPQLRIMAFSPTRGELMTGSSDGTTVLWNVDPAAWANRACDLAGRTLNRQEWGELLPGRGYHPTCTGSSR
jgi:WD40 repeat protein